MAIFNAGGNPDKIKIKELWRNASSGSSFAAQTVNIDLSDYDLVLIVVRPSTSASARNAFIGLVGRSLQINTVVNATATNAVMQNMYRTADIKTNGVEFSVCTAKAYNTTGTEGTKNGYCIPCYIYGVEGVKL